MPDATVEAVLRSGVEATFVPEGHQHGWMALWTGTNGEPIEGADAELELVLPAGTQARRKTLPVRRLALREAIDDLACLPADAEVSRQFEPGRWQLGWPSTWWRGAGSCRVWPPTAPTLGPRPRSMPPTSLAGPS